MERSFNKPGTPGPVPSKTIIINWLRGLFPDLGPNLKIQQFGNGVIYCRIMNHYYGSPHLQKINWHPKNQYEYMNNLKNVQTTLLQQGLTLPLDINKISKKKFLQNWQLVNIFYKILTSPSENTLNNDHLNDQNSVANLNTIKHKNFGGFNSHTKKQGSLSVTKNYPPQASYLQFNREDFRQKFMPISPLNQNNYFAMLEPSYYPKQRNNQSLPFNNADFGKFANHSLNMTQFWKENMNQYQNQKNMKENQNQKNIPSPVKGKWSCSAQFFQTNQSALIDRVKEILLKACNDTQKVKQAKMLLGMAIEEQQVIKIEEEEIGHVVYAQLEDKFLESSNVCSKQVKLQGDGKQNPPPLRKESCTKDLNKISVSKIQKKPFKI